MDWSILGFLKEPFQGARRVGRFVQEHPALTAQVAIGFRWVYLAEVTANQVLHPEWGIIGECILSH